MTQEYKVKNIYNENEVYDLIDEYFLDKNESLGMRYSKMGDCFLFWMYLFLLFICYYMHFQVGVENRTLILAMFCIFYIVWNTQYYFMLRGTFWKSQRGNLINIEARFDDNYDKINIHTKQITYTKPFRYVSSPILNYQSIETGHLFNRDNVLNEEVLNNYVKEVKQACSSI